jgi:hypothetical protein
MVYDLIKIGGLALSALAIGLPTSGNAQPAAFPPETLLSQEFVPNPLELTGNSGGRFPANRVIARERTPTGLCLGYINALPNHIMTLEVFFDDLSVRVESEQDTTLIVQGPGGIWCSDDAEGHNPAIEGQWLAGTYQIWVGSYVQTQSADYNLLIESSVATKAREAAEAKY